MVLKFFSVFDQKAKAFLPPFCLPEAAMAIRAFTDCVNDASHAFGKHPEDYSLFQVGSFDNDDGLMKGEPNGVECLVTGVVVKARSEA